MKNAAQRPDVTHRETPADGGDEGSRWRQRARVADVHAGICADVHAGRRRMTTVTLEAVCQAATRLADLDRSLWAARTPEGSPARQRRRTRLLGPLSGSALPILGRWPEALPALERPDLVDDLVDGGAPHSRVI
jgi:hypothetical protein